MILNHVKLVRPVTFKKYFASLVPLIFLSKTLTLSKMALFVSNLLKLIALVVNDEEMKTPKIFINFYIRFINT